MALRDILGSGAFAVTAELGPPADPDPELVRAKARALAGFVDAANVTDNQAATVKLSPLACSVWMLAEGLEPIVQLTTRDRNVMALQSDLLGAWALGARAILALSGDPLKVGPYESLATPRGRPRLERARPRSIAAMNEGTLAAGETLTTPTGFLVGGAANPLVDPVEKLEGKLDAGTHFFQTNIVYDVDRFAEWFAPVVAAGIAGAGAVPRRRRRRRGARGCSEHMHDNIPGIEVDDATFARLEGLEGDEAKDAGVEVAVDVVRRVREVPGVAGVHLMAPGWEAEAVPARRRGRGAGRPLARAARRRTPRR